MLIRTLPITWSKDVHVHELGAGRDFPGLTVISGTTGLLASGDGSKNDSWP